MPNTFEALTPVATPIQQVPSANSFVKDQGKIKILTAILTHARIEIPRIINKTSTPLLSLSKRTLQGGRKAATHKGDSFHFEAG